MNILEILSAFSGTPEARERLRQANLGKKLSPETRRKIGAARKGVPDAKPRKRRGDADKLKPYGATDTHIRMVKKWQEKYPDHIVDKLKQAHLAAHTVKQKLEAKYNRELSTVEYQNIHSKIKTKLGVTPTRLNQQFPKVGKNI